MRIGDIIGDGKSRIANIPPREVVLERREARKTRKRELEAMGWTAHRGCGWNHKCPTTADLDSWTKPRGTAKPAKAKWEDPPEWIVDPDKPYTHHNGQALGPCPNVGPLKANEAAAIPGGTRKKRLNRKYGPKRMSWNDLVQHGMMVEK